MHIIQKNEAGVQLPSWLTEIVDAYNSHAANQFVLAGNIHDIFPAPTGDRFTTLGELIQEQIVPRFNVVLSYDIGNGLRVERGGDLFGKWHEKADAASEHPRALVELITLYLRYAGNMANLGQSRIKVAVILRDTQLFASDRGDLDTNALAFLVREWSRDPLLARHDFVSFILTESFSDLHPLLRQNGHALQVTVPLPAPAQFQSLFQRALPTYPKALAEISSDLPAASRQLTGTSLSAVLGQLKIKEHQGAPIHARDLLRTKSALIEKECPGLMEVLSPNLTLDHLHGSDSLKKHLRQNISLWREGRLDLLPMGYLLCGPVGTGKTFVVRCLAGEANVPVIVLKNFREKWYGSTESNLEKIFRTIKAIGRCYVFIDEADQTLGRRESFGSEPGVSGRIYSMLAQEMSNKENRGKIIWILATSRPDLVEVDLKRPGRIDLKIPLFPTVDATEGFHLIQNIARNHGIPFPDNSFSDLAPLIPDLLTPGEVDAFITQLKRELAIQGGDPVLLLKERLANYLRPVPTNTIMEQIRLAMGEASDATFIPPRFRLD